MLRRPSPPRSMITTARTTATNRAHAGTQSAQSPARSASTKPPWTMPSPSSSGSSTSPGTGATPHPDVERSASADLAAEMPQAGDRGARRPRRSRRSCSRCTCSRCPRPAARTAAPPRPPRARRRDPSRSRVQSWAVTANEREKGGARGEKPRREAPQVDQPRAQRQRNRREGQVHRPCDTVRTCQPTTTS